MICLDACFQMIFVLHHLPNLHVKDMVQRVHVDPQIREQEFGNFQDPGLTQKAQQGAKSPCLGSWGVILLGRCVACLSMEEVGKVGAFTELGRCCRERRR